MNQDFWKVHNNIYKISIVLSELSRSLSLEGLESTILIKRNYLHFFIM